MSNVPPSLAQLNVDRLQILRRVGERGSIAAAARDCGISASAVSQQLSALEREVGIPLLERAARGVSLTGTGEMLAERARMIGAILEDAHAALERASGVSATVRIAAVASACTTLVSPALHTLNSGERSLDAVVTSCEPVESLALLASGDTDIAIIDEYDHVPLAVPDALVRTKLCVDPLVAVMRAQDAGGADSTTLRRLAGLDWVMPPDSAACGRAVRTACRAQGFEPRVSFQTDDMYLLVRAVQLGHGVAVLPRRAVAEHGSDLVQLPLRRPALQRTLSILTRKSSAARPSMQAISKCLIEQSTS